MKHGVRSLLIALVAITALVSCNRRGESQTDGGGSSLPNAWSYSHHNANTNPLALTDFYTDSDTHAAANTGSRG
jgi:hypothetical protein